jgi:amidohydrolase
METMRACDVVVEFLAAVGSPCVSSVTETSMALTDQDILELTAWRRRLHQHPEISNEEKMAAHEVIQFLAETRPDQVLTGLGGHGVAAIYESGKSGPTVMFRSELDALPIHELSGVAHASLTPGKSHMCGHDGHTAILAAVGRQLGRTRPARGRVVLMFQPAEETGNGAAGVVADPRFAAIAPDFAFALHNLPGVPIGQVRVKAGVVNCASRGMRIILEGKNRAFVHARDRPFSNDGNQLPDAGTPRTWHRNLC